VLETQIPELTKGMIAYLKGKTIAGDSVMEVAGRASRAPYHQVTWEGDIQQIDTRVPRGRITIDTIGRTPAQARWAARQVREAIIPPQNVTYGVHATLIYRDEEEDRDRTITLSGARLESGPREGPDQRERIITTYLVDYY
jgi:hypothetical protein